MHERREGNMLGFDLFLILIVALIVVAPAWPYSRDWGYYPTGGCGLALVIVGVLLLAGAL